MVLNCRRSIRLRLVYPPTHHQSFTYSTGVSILILIHKNHLVTHCFVRGYKTTRTVLSHRRIPIYSTLSRYRPRFRFCHTTPATRQNPVNGKYHHRLYIDPQRRMTNRYERTTVSEPPKRRIVMCCVAYRTTLPLLPCRIHVRMSLCLVTRTTPAAFSRNT